jgi:chromosome segregation ATPase
VSYLIAQISVYLVLACLIGLSLGWLLWGELARRIRTEAAELRSKLTDLEARHRSTLADRDQFEKRILDREGEIAGLRMRVLEPSVPTHEMEDKLKTIAAERDSIVAQLKEQQRVAVSLMEERQTEIIELRARIVSLQAKEQTTAAGARALSQEWETALSGKDDIIAELKTAAAQKESELAESQGKIEALFSQHNVLAAAQDRLRAELEEKDLRLRDAPKQLARLLAQPLPHDEVVKLAHGYAAARNFQGGSEQEDWIRAENEVRVRLLRDYLTQDSLVATGTR